MRKLHLIFDMSNMTYRAYYVMRQPDLTYAPNRRELVNRVVVDCFAIVRQLSPFNIHFCFDGSKNFRKLVDHTYKEGRSGTPGMDDVLNELYDLFIYKDLNAIRVDKLEADDCIALLCERLETSHKFIVTGDGDIKQLVRPRTYVMPPVNDKRVVACDEYSSNLVKNSFPQWPAEAVNPNLVLFEKILKGCKSDNVTGLGPKGLRMTKITQLVQEFEEQIEKGEEEFNALYNAIAWTTHSPVIEVKRQLQLVCLQSTYMPEDAVNEFFDIQLKDAPPILSAQHILANTAYFL